MRKLPTIAKLCAAGSLVLFVLTNLSNLKAMKNHSAPDYPSDEELTKAIVALRTALNKNSNEKERCIITKYNVNVDVFIMFDEAHTLTDCYDKHRESRFVMLQQTLSVLSSLELPLFLFFLSTTGKVTQFSQPRGHDNSDHINDGYLATPRPFIFVGFDQLVQNHKVRRGSTLDDVTSLDFVAHLGRPL